MRGWARRNLAVALVSAVALALFTVFSYQAAVVSEPHPDHSQHADQRFEGPEPAAEHAVPGEHCHPGFDCFVIAALEPPESGFPSGAAHVAPKVPFEELLQSVITSPRPPPPRTATLPRDGPIQT
jgi:hypothetical protein